MADRSKQLTVQQIKQVTRHQTELARQRIAVSKLVDKAQAIAMGEQDATATQARVLLGLLDKVLPTISKSEHEETVTHQHGLTDATRELLENIATRLPKPEKRVKAEVIEHRDSVLQATDFATLEQGMNG